MDHNYEVDLEIDQHQLDQEWLNQPNLFMKYAEAQAEAKRILDNAHEHVKVTRSKLVRECKSNFPKATGPEIEAYYREDKRHRRAKDKMIEAEYDYSLMCGAVQGFHMRKRALEDLVRLWAGEYYSSPRSPKDVDPEHDTNVKKKAARDKIRGRSTRTRKSRRTK